MIVSFEVKEVEDLELLLSLTKRLGIKRVEKSFNDKIISQKSKIDFNNEVTDSEEINIEIDSIFGIDNSNLSF